MISGFQKSVRSKKLRSAVEFVKKAAPFGDDDVGSRLQRRSVDERSAGADRRDAAHDHCHDEQRPSRDGPAHATPIARITEERNPDDLTGALLNRREVLQRRQRRAVRGAAVERAGQGQERCGRARGVGGRDVRPADWSVAALEPHGECDQEQRRAVEREALVEEQAVGAVHGGFGKEGDDQRQREHANARASSSSDRAGRIRRPLRAA